MIEAIITLLIYICVIALIIYLVVYVLEVIGVPLPPKAVQIIMVIFGLIAILLLARIVVGVGGVNLPGL